MTSIGKSADREARHERYDGGCIALAFVHAEGVERGGGDLLVGGEAVPRGLSELGVACGLQVQFQFGYLLRYLGGAT